MTVFDDFVAEQTALGEMSDFLKGGASNDVLVGAGLYDTILGRSGDDILLGRSGDYVVRGGAGDDEAVQGADDVIVSVGDVQMQLENFDLADLDVGDFVF